MNLGQKENRNMSEKKKIIVVKPADENSKPEKYLQETETAENLWEDWPEEVKEKTAINKAVARELVRRKTAMKIVRLLYERNEPLKQKEIYQTLKIYRQLAQHNLKCLMKASVVRLVNAKAIDRTARYYELSLDRELVAKLIQRFENITELRK
jgi:hypothetical protein